MSRPTEKPAWTQGNPSQQLEPTNSEKFGGYSPNQRPGPKKFNWLLGNISDWIDWFDSWGTSGSLPVSNVGHVIATGTTLQEQLDEFDAYISSLGLQQGGLVGTVNGTNGSDGNNVFTVPFMPLSADSIVVFLDGLEEDQTVEYDYALILGVPTITFHAPSIPVVGQKPRCVGMTATGPGSGGSLISGGFVVYGSAASGITVVAGTGVVSTADQRALIFIKSAGGAVAVTANPQISAGTKVGQELRLVGTSDVDYITLADGSGLSLNGPISMRNKQSIDLWWDGVVWNENDRK